MSNLTLPKMTYVTLKGMISNARARHPFKPDPVITLAYRTTAEWCTASDFEDAIRVRHHGNPIALIGRDFITINGSGWNSRTTADRLNTILRDNQTTLPTDPQVTDRLWYSVSSRDNQKEFGLFLYGRSVSGEVTRLRDVQFQSAHFSRVSSDHHLVLHG